MLPRFFKILLPTYLQKLPIPRRFVQKIGGELPDVAHLKGPGDRVWCVELKETDGIIFFLKGWKEFVESCCLKVGYLLVFRYDGNSQFSVLIFDKSACEKEYSSGNDDEESCSNTGSCTPEDESDDSVEILGVSKVENEDLHVNKRNHTYIPNMLRSSLRLQSLERRMDLEAKSKISKGKELSEVERSKSQQSKFKKLGGIQRGGQVELLDHRPYARHHDDDGELDQSNGMELMEPIHKNVLLNSKEKAPDNMAPVAVAWQFLESSVPSSMEGFSIKKENLQLKPDAMGLHSGNLNYSSSPEKRMVSVKKRIHSFVSGKRESKALRMQRELAEATQFNSNNPFFLVSIKLSNLTNGPCLQIPSQFVSEHLPVIPRRIRVKGSSNGQTWVIGCRRRENGALFLSSGWSAFLFDNSLVRGDVCAFELVKRRHFGFKVTIYPADKVLHAKQLSDKWPKREYIC